MDQFIIQGAQKLNGEVKVSGAKNSVLPLMFASLLADGRHVFKNVPNLQDVQFSCLLLESLGMETRFSNGELEIIVNRPKCFEARYELVKKMRASILCLGPLLTRWGEAVVSIPGGCAIGTRPIDQHLEGLIALGAHVDIEGGYVRAKAKKLCGAQIVFDGMTVGGTENILMAAVLAEGTTRIENAAKEPEVEDLAHYLCAMGAKIKGIGTSIIEIEGVEKLSPAEHTVIPDRIETGTLLIAGAITSGEVTVQNTEPKHIKSLIDVMRQCGICVSEEGKSLHVSPHSGYKAIDISTNPYPGFPTDMQAQYMSLMTQSEGTSVITENIFENRFMHVPELLRMNANITSRTKVAVVRGEAGGLKGAPVMATDLRASASLVLAGLVAKGETCIRRIYHLDRGYERLEEKLVQLGAKVLRKKGK